MLLFWNNSVTLQRFFPVVDQLVPSGVSSCLITELSSSIMSSPLRSLETPWTCWGSRVYSCTWFGCAWLALPPTAATSRGWGSLCSNTMRKKVFLLTCRDTSVIIEHVSLMGALLWFYTDEVMACGPSSTRPMSSSSESHTPGWWTSSRWWWPTASPAPSSSPLVRVNTTHCSSITQCQYYNTVKVLMYWY